jgi:hypothetical protein
MCSAARPICSILRRSRLRSCAGAPVHHRRAGERDDTERVAQIVRDDRERQVARPNGLVRHALQTGDLASDARADGEPLEHLLVVVGELPGAALVRDVKTAQDLAAERHGNAEEGRHDGVARREPAEPRRLAHVLQTNGTPLACGQPERPHGTRGTTEALRQALVEAHVDEGIERLVRSAADPQRGKLGVDEVPRFLDDDL